MGTVTRIRREVLPKELYDLIERFMMGEIASMQITTLSNTFKIEHFSFGDTPKPLADISSNTPCRIYEIKGKKN
ncbi:MAG: hypothetical protein H6R14_792 [Proteobacteria bacterium]|nr:hypothetical protein [Pseudomonadota bacterium]